MLDAKYAKQYELIETFGQAFQYDSLERLVPAFHEALVRSLSADTSALSYSFPLLAKNPFRIVTSADGLFRIYSWDDFTGGTMRFFQNIYQFRSGSHVYTKAKIRAEGDAGGYYSEIYTLNANNRVYYLAIGNGIGSTKDLNQSIEIFSIENKTLNESTGLIKTQSGLTSSISVAYDFFSVVNRPERPVRLIKYDPVKKIISIPIVYENGKVTDRYILYQFKGQYFEKLPVQKNSQ